MGNKVQTVEQTGKKWKLCQLLGAIPTFLGIGFCYLGIYPAMLGSSLSLKLVIGGGIMAALGFGLYLYGRLGEWWNHA